MSHLTNFAELRVESYYIDSDAKIGNDCFDFGL